MVTHRAKLKHYLHLLSEVIQVEDKTYKVYIHTNQINQKKYIGITCQKPEYRWGSKGQGYIECPYFWRSIQKYGWDKFSHQIYADNLTRQEACEMEIRQIAEMKTNDPSYGYNISKGGDGLDPDLIKSMWKDDSFKADMIARMRAAWTDPDKRMRRSEAAKDRWSDPSFKQFVTNQVTKACGRKIQCVETDIVYNTIKEVEDTFGLCKANICRAAKKGYKCGGYHWKYVDNVS